MPGEQDQGSQARKGVSPAAVRLSAVNELGIEPERDVVQEEPVGDSADVDSPLGAVERVESAHGIVTIQPQIAREVVPRPEGDADQR